MINEEMTGAAAPLSIHCAAAPLPIHCAAAPLPCRGGAGVGSVIFLSFGSAMYLRFNDLLFTIYVLFIYDLTIYYLCTIYLRFYYLCTILLFCYFSRPYQPFE